MMKRIIKAGALGFLIMLAVGTIPFFDAPWRYLQLIPMFLMTQTMKSGNRDIWIFAIVSGLIFDLFSILPPGANVVIFSATAAFSRFLFLRWFTNRSIFAFLTLTFLTVIWYLCLLALAHFAAFFITRDQTFMISGAEMFKVIWMSALINILAMLVFRLVSNRFERLLGFNANSLSIRRYS